MEVDISLFNQFLVVWKFLLSVRQTCQNQSRVEQDCDTSNCSPPIYKTYVLDVENM